MPSPVRFPYTPPCSPSQFSHTLQPHFFSPPHPSFHFGVLLFHFQPLTSYSSPGCVHSERFYFWFQINVITFCKKYNRIIFLLKLNKKTIVKSYFYCVICICIMKIHFRYISQLRHIIKTYFRYTFVKRVYYK